MKWVNKFKIELVLILGIILLYFILRLPNLTLQPIFADEAIYIRWAQVMRAEPTLRFVSLSDGKTPLFMWLMIPFFKIIHDPLLAGRLLSVLSGLVTLLGVFALSWKLFNKKAAFWSVLIYAVVPYTVFFDRMALVDSMLATFTIWAIFIAVWLVKIPRLDLAMILGYLLGGGLLVKTPGMFNLLGLPLVLFGFSFKKNSHSQLLKVLLYLGIALVIASVIYNLLRLGPGFQQLSARNADYVFSPTDLIGRPLDPFLPHLGDLTDWLPKLITWPVLLAVATGIVYLIGQQNRLGLSIIFWALVPLLIQMAFLKTFTARYLLFSIPPFLVIGGFGISELLKKIKRYKVAVTLVALIVISSFAVQFDYLLLTNPQKADLPKNERRGYLEDWTAGYGFAEIANFILQENQKHSVVVGTEGYFGTLPDGLQIYLDKANIPIIGGSATISAKLREATDKNTVFFVGNENRVGKYVKNAQLLMEYSKAIPLDTSYPRDAIVVYRVFPE